MKAHDFLAEAADIMVARGKQYDSPGGERSFEKVSMAFNAITGKYVTAAEMALIQQLFKDVRQWATPTYHVDSALDAVGYAALKAEELAKEATPTCPKCHAPHSNVFKCPGTNLQKASVTGDCDLCGQWADPLVGGVCRECAERIPQKGAEPVCARCRGSHHVSDCDEL